MINKASRESSSLVKIKAEKKMVSSFLGINYAIPVENAFRWSSSKVKRRVLRSQNDHGFIAPQIAQTFDLLSDNNEVSDAPIEHEQCLNLNIFTPDDTKQLPVMVWIHGGGFQVGSGSLSAYDGHKLAQSANVVVVTLNYRLGALGFLRLCDISNGAISSTGNEGLTDQITALKWVQKNIIHYGGDKNNVTLFGESAGAMSIACLLASPLAKSLFHKVILQSGASHTYSSVEKANHVAKEFIKSASARGYVIEDLPKMTTQELLDVQQHFLNRPDIYQQFGMLPFSPVVDGDLLPLPPYEAIKQGSARHIQIISGSNTDEWTLFAAMTGQNINSSETLNLYLQALMEQTLIPSCLLLVDKALSKRKVEITHQNRLNEVLSEYWFTQPCHRLLANHTFSGGRNYRYKLGRRTIDETLGCTHITDIGFVFGTTEEAFHGTAPRVNELKDEMQAAWSAFAHSGDPSTLKVQWPVYGSSNKLHYLFFDHTSSYITEHELDNVYFWSQITDQQLADF
jgi:para-nitrobenzyl esterase